MTSPIEEWHVRKQRQDAAAARDEVSMRRRLDANRARLAAKEARFPAEVAELLHRNSLALMAGGTILPDGTNGEPRA